ncbi:hypothetical protein Vqi01_11170 [Micromonospora qiuiae]|uniref:Acyl-CoA carboxylase subunit epsilon n=2 Tax=Micromonospora qiuiae TaxID=502268 RepID=A0ABQ4J7J5_9ACTN|nr:hypothetical protein Vqi01_11170 [Micromonospora qiuiae]
MSRYRSATSWGEEASDIAETVPGNAEGHTAGTPLCDEDQGHAAYAEDMPVDEPLFRIVRGAPTAEEVAALVGALLARSRPAAPPSPAPASAWARSGRPAGTGHLPGPGAWRASGLPN